jgi:hypothetical protein
MLAGLAAAVGFATGCGSSPGGESGDAAGASSSGGSESGSDGSAATAPDVLAETGSEGSSGTAGALSLSIDTDMQTPKDLDTISVFVTEGPDVKLDEVYLVAPLGTVSLPWELTLPDGPGASVQIRVIGYLGATALVLRDIQTTVPQGVTALLRVPLDFIDKGSASGTLPSMYDPSGGAAVPEGTSTFNPDVITSTCDPMQDCEMTGANCQTMINGVCGSAILNSSTLPTAPADGGAPACFEVATCFAEAAVVANLDMPSCSFPLPSGASTTTLNVAVVTSSTGACPSTRQCYVPLPADPVAGWSVAGDTVTLVPGVCAKLVDGVSLATSSGTCPSMRAGQPVCQPTTGPAATSD